MRKRRSGPAGGSWTPHWRMRRARRRSRRCPRYPVARMSQMPPRGEWCITPGVEASKRVGWILAMFERWNSGDVDGFLDALGPDFEFTPDPSFPDTDTCAGDKLRNWMREWVRTWAESRLEVLETRERGTAIVVESRWHLRAKAGAQVPLNDFNVVVWVRSRSRAAPAAGTCVLRPEACSRGGGRHWLTRQSAGVCSGLQGLVA
jgi:ketosteroid isomerase-like protein